MWEESSHGSNEDIGRQVSSGYFYRVASRRDLHDSVLLHGLHHDA